MDHRTPRVLFNGTEYWKSKFFELEGNFWQVENQKSELQTKFEVGKSQYSVLHFDFEKMKKEFVVVKKKVEPLTMENNMVKDEFKERKRICEELNEGFKKKLNDSEAQAALKGKYGVELVEVYRNKYDECKRMYEELNEGFKKKVTDLETQLDLKLKNEVEMEEKLETYRSKYDDCKRVCEELNEGFKKKVTDLETQLDLNLQKEVELEEKLETYRSKYDECEALKEGFKKKVTDLETQLDWNLQNELDLEEKLETYRRIYDECEALKEGFKKKVTDLETQLDLNLQNEVEIEEKFETYRRKYDELYVELLEKTRELNDQKSIRISTAEICVKLSKEVKELEFDKKRVENEVEVMRTKLESQTAMNIGVELRKEMEVYRQKCDGFEGQLKEKEMERVGVEGQLKSLLAIKVALNEEIEQYKTTCTGLQKQILGLVEERKVMVDTEVKAQKRITYLKEIVKRMESGAKEASVHAKTENMDVVFRERTAEGETKKKFLELETQVLKLEEEKLALTIQIEEFNRKSRELGIQADLRLKYELDLEKKLEGYKTKHDELCANYKKKKARLLFLENELKKYKTMCTQLNKQVKSLEEDKKDFSLKERRQQENITCLEKENKKMMKSDDADMCVQLNKKIMDLECEKRRAKDETEVLKTKFRELESQTDLLKCKGIGLGKELEICRLKCNSLSVALKEKEMECVGFEQKLKNLMLIKVALDDELEGCKTAFNELKEQIMGLGEDQKVSCEKEKKSQQRITYLEELVKKFESDERELKAQILRLDIEKSALRCLDSHDNRESGFELRGLQDKVKNNTNNLRCEVDSGTNDANVAPSTSKGDEHVSGPSSTNNQYKPLENVKNKKNNTQFQSTVKVEPGHELEGSSSEKLHILDQVSVRTSSRGITEINDSKDGKDIAPKYICNITDKERDQFSSDAAFKSPSDNGKNLSSMKGSKRPLENQRCEDYESIFKEDITLVPLSSISKRSRSAETVISRSESTVGDTIPVGSHKSLILLRQCQEKNSFPDMSNNPCQKVGNPIFKNGNENVVEEIGYESEGQCAGGIRVQCSYSLGSHDSSGDSEDSSNVDSSFHQALAMMKRNRRKNSKWQFEADMVSSLEEDPELCMKAVCALYRQKSMEKLMTGSSHSNNRGFNEYDALRGTALAEFLTNGDPKGDLKKSVKDLEMFDQKSLEYCKRLATNYSKQLFSIYQKKEDPFFLPS